MLTNHAIVAALEEDLLWQLPFFQCIEERYSSQIASFFFRERETIVVFGKTV